MVDKVRLLGKTLFTFSARKPFLVGSLMVSEGLFARVTLPTLRTGEERLVCVDSPVYVQIGLTGEAFSAVRAGQFALTVVNGLMSSEARRRAETFLTHGT